MKLKIRYKLLIGFTFLVLLSLLIYILIYFLAKAYISSQIDTIHLEKAEIAADKIVNFFSLVESDMRSLAKVYKTSPISDKDDVFTTVKFILDKDDPFIKKISIIAPSGKELLKSDTSGNVPEEKLSYEISTDQLKSAFQGKTAVSKVYYVDLEPGPHVDIFSPIFFDKNTVHEVIKMQLNITKLWSEIISSKPGESGFAYIVDDEGRVIAHPNAKFVFDRPNLSSRTVIAVLLKNNTSTVIQNEHIYRNENNQLVTSQATKIPGLNWISVFEQPVSQAYEFIVYIRNIFIFTLFGSVFLLLLISLFLSENLTRPIRKLQKATQLLEKGELGISFTIKSGDEIEELGNAFQNLVKNLQETILKLKEQRIKSDETAGLLFRRELDLREINEELEIEKKKISTEIDKLQLVLSAMTDAVITIDLKNNIATFNKAAENLTGYPEKDVIGKPIYDVISVFDETNKVPLNNLYESTGKNIFHLTGNNNKEAYVQIIAGHIQERTVADLRYILTIHNVTEERELETMKYDFVSMAAHELRTPLTSIKGYLSVFIKENENTLTDEQKMLLAHAESSAQKLGDLVERLLSISRIERGMFTVSLESLEWIPFVHQTVEEFMERAKEKNITLTFTKPTDAVIPENICVHADKLRIGEVLSNLIANAINYTSEGGKVTIWLEKTETEIITHVTDTGEGIPQEAIPNLFTKFFRVAGTLTKSTKGTGLGLYVSKSIVQLHHGKIWVESTYGSGSTFSFSIPLEKLV